MVYLFSTDNLSKMSGVGFMKWADHNKTQSPFSWWGGYFVGLKSKTNPRFTDLYHFCKEPKAKSLNERVLAIYKIK